MATGFLIFIDTNIFLDFYRVRGREGGLSILSHIEQNLTRFITTSQVEMEYKKHRQRAIVEAHIAFKAPDMQGLQLPAFLAETKQSRALTRNRKEVQRLSTTLKDRMGLVLNNPTTNDRVYRVAQRLFRARSPWNLGRDKKERYAIRRLARKRFGLGYPPRKNDDTSMGDAINWEWVVDCAIKSKCHVVIVSRDTDYGITFEKKNVINDWLLQEFRDRVSKKRKLLLTDRLSVALKEAGINVSEKQVASEEKFLEAREENDQLLKTNLVRVATESSNLRRMFEAFAKQAGGTLTVVDPVLPPNMVRIHPKVTGE